MAGINDILEWFKTGKKPTQAQFWASWQSFWHKDDQIPQGSVNGLPSALNSKADNAQFNGHKNDPNAHGFNDRFALKEHEHQITDVAGLQEQVEALGRLADEVIRLDENVQILKTANFTLENNMHKATIFCQGTGTINVKIPILLRQDFICLLYNVGTGNVLPVLEDIVIQSMVTKDGAILLESNRHGIIEHFMGGEKFIVRENTANEFCIKKDIYGNSKNLRPNTFIGGIAKLGGTGGNAPIRTAFDLAQKLGINANKISSFRIVNDDVECHISVQYGNLISLGSSVEANANQNLTSFIDADGLITGNPVGNNQLRNCKKLEVLDAKNLGAVTNFFMDCSHPNFIPKLPKLTRGSLIFSQLDDGFNQSKLGYTPALANLEGLAFHNCLGFTELNLPLVTTLVGGSNFYGLRNCERYFLNGIISIAGDIIWAIGNQKCRLIEMKKCKSISSSVALLVNNAGIKVPHPTDFKVRINETVKNHVCFTNLKTDYPQTIIEVFDDSGNHISTL